jgi:hypothetical protein
VRAVQYVAWPIYPWEELRTRWPGVYESAIGPVPDPAQWFHVRIELTHDTVRVFVDGGAQPCLVVKRMRSTDPAVRATPWLFSSTAARAPSRSYGSRRRAEAPELACRARNAATEVRIGPRTEESMKAIRRFAWVLSMGLAASACGGAATSTAGATAPPGTSVSSAATPDSERSRRADITFLLLDTTGDLSLADAQRMHLRAVGDRLVTSEKETRAAFKALNRRAAAAVRTGAMDASSLQTDVGTAVAALRGHVAAEAEALDAVHAMLDPAQRRAVVASLRDRQGGGLAEAQGGSAIAAPSVDERRQRRLERLTHELALDPAQQVQVAVAIAAQPALYFPRPADRERRTDRLLNAFASDGFDARAFVTPQETSPTEIVREHAGRAVTFLARIVPILASDQREKLAATLEARGLREWDD